MQYLSTTFIFYWKIYSLETSYSTSRNKFFHAKHTNIDFMPDELFQMVKERENECSKDWNQNEL